MTTLVLDASVIVDAVTTRAELASVLAAIRTGIAPAPAHLAAETASGIGRLMRAGTISPEASTSAIADVAELDIPLVPVRELLLDAWELREDFRLADALYVVLARRRQATLLTVDERLVAAAPDVARLP